MDDFGKSHYVICENIYTALILQSTYLVFQINYLITSNLDQVIPYTFNFYFIQETNSANTLIIIDMHW